MNNNTKNKMAIKPILPLLLSMAFPPMVSMLVQSMYNIIDSMFVAQYSPEALTAVSLAFPVQNLILAVAVGTGVGVNSYISRKLGEKDTASANNAVTHGLLLSLISAVLFMIGGFFLLTPFFRMFTDSPVMLGLSVEYTWIIVSFSFACIFHINIEKVLQGTGKMLFPMMLQIVGAVVNIILDPIFIFGRFGFPEMGVRGAAIATVIGQMTAMLLSFAVLIFSKHDVKIQIKGFKLNLSVIKDIYTVGLPSILMIALSSVLITGLNAVLIGFSAVAVSVLGVYFKLQTFVHMPVSGLTQGAMPIIGYNYGAQNRERVFSCLRSSNLISIGIMAAGTAIFWIFPAQLLSIFQPDAQMLAMGVPALRILSLSFIPSSIAIIQSTMFQGMGKGTSSLVVFLLRQFVITLPLAFLLSGPLGVLGIWVSFPVAEVIAAIAALVFRLQIQKSDLILAKSVMKRKNIQQD